MNYEFTFEMGKILVDGREASSAEIMDILISQQRQIDKLEEELDFLEMGRIRHMKKDK